MFAHILCICSSANNLNVSFLGYLDDTGEEAYSPPPPPSLGLADKIDNFLVAVGKQQEALTKMLEQRRLGKSSVLSKMSCVVVDHNHPSRRKARAGNGNNQRPTRPTRPQTAPRPRPKTRNNPQKVQNNIKLKQQ